MKRAAHSAAIENHYTKSWGPPLRRERLTRGPVHELPPDFEVLVFQRNDSLCYATSSMSQPLDDEALELHLMAEHAQPGLVELLTVVAHYHRTGHRLGLGHSVNFGRPWLVGATASFGLISLPYLDGPDLEWSAEPRIRFLWLLPITEREREFKKAHGTEALEQRFEEAELDYLNPNRNSVV
ncbi:MAG: suppressor of fused domain protein [Myxococcales bacterium]|nr:suppressor of fused domain protein [Myxococcales bacterium]